MEPDVDGCFDLGDIGSAREKNWERLTPYSLAKGKTMRKLAREAVIFALLGFLAETVIFFLATDTRATAKLVAANTVDAQEADAPIQGVPPGLVAIPIGVIEVPLTNGTVLHVRQCEPLPTPPPGYTLDSPVSRSDCRYFSNPYQDFDRKFGGRMVAIPLGDADQIAIEKEYWAAYSRAKRQTLLENGMASLILGLWGFPGGLGIWALYRLVRFAIKG
jgi:hypothetical protein